MEITVTKRPYIELTPAEVRAFELVRDTLYDIGDQLDNTPVEFIDSGWRFEGSDELYFMAEILNGFAEHFEFKKVD